MYLRARRFNEGFELEVKSKFKVFSWQFTQVVSLQKAVISRKAKVGSRKERVLALRG